MNVAIIGCGGIGSYFIGILDKLIETEQLKGYEFECFDDDKVETKNIIYQNFEAADIDEFKTEALGYRYVNINKYTSKRVSYDDISGYQLIILCADNSIIRKHAYNLYSNRGTRFIDARSNGRTVGIFTSNTDNYLDTVADTEESFSCQYPYQLEKKEIELGNVIIAGVLAQGLLNFKRTGNLPADFVHNF